MSLKQKFVPVSGSLPSVEGTRADVSANPYLKKVLALPKMIGLLVFAIILSLSATGSALAGSPPCGGPGDPCPVAPRLTKDSISPGRHNPVNIWTLETSVATTDFTADDIVATNATVTLSGGGTNYTATITAIAEGKITVQVKANSFSSGEGTFNTQAGEKHEYYYDTVRPTATLGALRGPDASNKFKSTLIVSEPVQEFGNRDLYCKLCFVRDITGDGPTYEVTIESELHFDTGETGTILLSLRTGGIVDLAGNAMITLPEPVTYTVEDMSPTATIASLDAFEDIVLIKGQSVNSILINLSEPSTDFTVDDIEAVNATVTLRHLINASYSATLTPLADGVATIQIKANSFSNEDGVFNKEPSNRESVTADVTPPTITLSRFTEPVDGKIKTTVTLSEDSTNFSADDFNVTNGTVTLSGSGRAYEATITPTKDGFVVTQVAGGKFSDEAGNLNELASNLINTLFDPTPPTVTIAEFVGPNAEGKYTAAITLSEPAFEYFGEGGQIPTFTVEDLDVTNGTVTLSGSETSYVATVTPTGGREIALQVKAGSISDPAGNVNAEASNRVTVITDTTPPTATISPFTGPIGGEFRAAITLSEVSTDFATDDLNVTNGTVVITGSGTSYQASVTPSADGDLTLQVKSGSFSDAAGNTNTETSNTVTATFDSTPPTATIAAFVGPADGKYTAAITLSESSLQFFGEGRTAPSFTVDDLMVTNGTVTLTGSGTSFTATVTPIEDGEVTLQVKASSFGDLAGNTNTDASNTVTATFDSTPPTAVISSEINDLVSGAFTATITFSEGVTGFGLDDITVSNGAASEFGATSAAVYTATITPEADGVVTVNVAAAAAQDGAGNPSAAAPQFSITNDGSAPTVSIIVASTEVTGPFRAQFVFSESVNDLLAETIVISNGTLSDFSGSDTEYSGLVTPTTLGTIDISVPAGATQDAAGNKSEEANLSVSASSGGEAVTVVVASGDSPSDTNGTVTLANPGSLSLDFIAFTDQPWLDVTPASGQIPSLGDLEVSFKVNDLILDFPAGTYVANLIVQVDEGAGTASGAAKANSNTLMAASSRRLIAEIPVTVELQEQRGDFELIVRTPSGLSNGSSFQLTSDIAAIDGQTVAANAGESRFAISDLLNGTYQIEQAALDGYLIADITCAGDTDNGNIIDVQSGRIRIDLDATERQTCIITNSRNDAAIRLATMKAIRGFMERRGDRIMSAAPDLSKRFGAREQVGAGAFNADANDRRASMSFDGSLSGARNQAQAKAVGDNVDLLKPRFDGWDVWTSAEYAKVKDRREGVGVDSEFFVAQLGADYQVRDNLLVGGLVQYDWMSEDDAVITPDVGALRGARLNGDGFMAGPYAVWKPAENLTVDAMGIFGKSSNNVDPFGYYEDQFETERFLLQTNVTGEFDWSGLRVRPQLGWAHYEDQQEDYIDSLGIEIPSQTVTIGRLRAGPELVWSHRKDDVLLELGSNLRAVWNYEGAGTLDLNTGSLSTGGDPIRVDGGLSASLAFKSGFRVSVETSFDGIGQGDFSARSGRISLSFPFGGAGGSSASQPVKSLLGRQSAAFNGCGGQSSLNGNNSFCSLDRF